MKMKRLAESSELLDADGKCRAVTTVVKMSPGNHSCLSVRHPVLFKVACYVDCSRLMMCIVYSAVLGYKNCESYDDDAASRTCLLC